MRAAVSAASRTGDHADSIATTAGPEATALSTLMHVALGKVFQYFSTGLLQLFSIDELCVIDLR